METRKVQFTGNSTFTLSLPREWVNRMGIKKGDLLGLMQEGNGRIVITPALNEKKLSMERTITINREQPAHVLRMLIGAYVMGFDTITVKGRDKLDLQIKDVVRQFTRSVTGVEIVEDTGNSVSVKDLSDISELSQEKATRRLYLIGRSMHVDVMTALLTDDRTLAADVVGRDTDADRIYWLIMKEHNMLSRNPAASEKLGVTPDESSAFFQISRYLERIADHAVQIAHSALSISGHSHHKEVLSKLKSAHEYAVSMLDDAISSFFRRSALDANRVIDRRETLGEMLRPISSAIRKIDSDDAIHIALIEESVRRVGYYSTDIGEVAINYCMLIQ
ncbi:MAG: PhoU domain-containing protein [Methanomassiliicoccales archaeon]